MGRILPISSLGSRVEEFTAPERARLAPHFSNVDGPVFALVDLPETVKGAMFARYSRYPGTLRRLFLDEFADSLPAARGRAAETSRAAARRSSSNASSSVTAMIRWRSSAARTSRSSGARTCSRSSSSARGWRRTSSSPRATSPTTRRCPAAATATTATPSSAPSTRVDGALFAAYSEALPRVAPGWTRLPAHARRVEAVRRRAVKAKALDLLRGLLPAASLSHMGIYASGQAYEQLIMHLLAHPLPEARVCGQRCSRRSRP